MQASLKRRRRRIMRRKSAQIKIKGIARKRKNRKSKLTKSNKRSPIGLNFLACLGPAAGSAMRMERKLVFRRPR